MTFLLVILPSNDSCISESFSVRSNVLIRSSSAVAPLRALTTLSSFRACIPWMTQKPNRLHKSLHFLCLPTPRLCSCIKITSSAFAFAQLSRLCIFCPSFSFNPFTLYVHILSFSAGPSPGYPRVLSYIIPGHAKSK